MTEIVYKQNIGRKRWFISLVGYWHEMSTITVSGKEIETAVGLTIEENILKAGLLPDAYLYIMDGRPVPMDTKVEDSMQIRAIKVASGG